MTHAYRSFVASKSATPQREQIPGTVQNSAGGFSFPVDDWTRLRRFLILGSESGSYYSTPQALTKENAGCVERCLSLDAKRTVEMIVEVSDRALAPKNDPALLALAIAASGSAEARGLALAALPKVARIGTHLLHFAEYVNGLRGWGRGLRKAVGQWYLSREVDDLGMQLVKYAQRDGWSHRDVLRLCHVHSAEPMRNAALRYAVKGPEVEVSAYPLPIEAAVIAKRDPAQLIPMIREHGLPRECVPTEELNRLDVWEALLERMPMTAMIRNLGKMSEVGLLKDLSAASKTVCQRLGDGDAIRRARVHPFALLLALRTYQQGQGFRGSLTWKPVARVVDALDAAFYLAFEHVQPTGKAILIGLDVSGSMDGSRIAGSPITAREAACAMAMVTARTEQNWACIAFSHQPVPFEIGARERLDDVIRRARALPFGETDCALPMEWARAAKLQADAFHVYTDSETHSGRIHPAQALRKFRQEMDREARLAVAAFTANQFSIADPSDAGMMDFAGMDASLPSLLAEFTAGRL